MKRLILCLALLAPASAFAQSDDIDFHSAQIVNSPGDLNVWPATARLQSVEFRADGWKLEFDRRRWNPWPNFTIPGWGGPIQYTLGMCLQRGGWKCSAVVQMWQGRIDEGEGTGGYGAGAPPEAIAETWFYDPQWGPLYNQQPAPDESVAVFVMAGDGRRIASAWPGALRERSDVRLIRWGVSQRFSDNGPAPVPQPEPTPTPVPVPTPQPEPVPTPVPAPVPTLDLSGVYSRLDALAVALDKHDHEPAYLTKILSNRYVQLALTGVGTWLAQQQLAK